MHMRVVHDYVAQYSDPIMGRAGARLVVLRGDDEYTRVGGGAVGPMTERAGCQRPFSGATVRPPSCYATMMPTSLAYAPGRMFRYTKPCRHGRASRIVPDARAGSPRTA